MMKSMIIGSTLALAAAGAAVAGPCGEARIVGPEAAAAAICAAEQAFAARVKANGEAAGFRDSMDPKDGLVFGKGVDPARGAAAIYAFHGGGAPDAGLLEWTPKEVQVGTAGDFGFTWGTWRYSLKANPAKAITGRYLTVWRKGPDGVWKGAADIGVPD